jgi:hypothetical protein
MRRFSRTISAVASVAGALTVAFSAIPARASSVVIESWENTLDGWQAPSPGGSNSSYSPSFSTTTGVTNGNYSLAMTGTASPDYTIMLNSPYSTTITNDLADATSVSLDVYAPAGSFGGALGIDMDIQNAAIGFMSLDGYDYQSPNIGTESTLTVPISSTLASELASSGDPTQFYIQVGGNYTPGNETVYFDNLRAINNSTTPQQWTPTGSGNWNNVANWNGSTIPNAVGAEADFFGAITANSTVYTDQPVTVGTINFNNANTYVVTGSSTLTMQTSSGNAQIIVQQGTQELNLPTTIASNTTLNVASNSALLIANPITIDSGNTLTQTGAGTVTYQSLVTVQSGAALAFANSTHANTLSIAAGGNASIIGSGNVVEVDNLSVGGTLDIGKNEVLVDYGNTYTTPGTDPMSSIRALIQRGYNNGAWNGPGIISSAIAAANANSTNPQYGVGFSDGADTINGHPIVSGLSSGQIEIKYTLLGDANLDGTVNGADFSILAANFGQGYTNWDQGNFLFTPAINGTDFSALAHNFGQGANLVDDTVSPADIAALDSFALANGLPLPNIVGVPEPASLLSLVFLAALTTRRRKKRSRS